MFIVACVKCSYKRSLHSLYLIFNMDNMFGMSLSCITNFKSISFKSTEFFFRSCLKVEWEGLFTYPVPLWMKDQFLGYINYGQ